MTIYYLTKHLVDGIVEADTETTEMAGPFMERPRTRLNRSGTAVHHHRKPGDWVTTTYHIGAEAFERREDAVADAEKRRAKKLAGLRRSIAKLEALNF